jgi:hypothetical protein
MRIAVMATRSLQAILVLTAAHAGKGGLIAVDVIGRRLLHIDPRKLAITPIAEGLPVSYGVVGSGPAAVEFPTPLHVTADGDIYLGTAGRGVIQLKAGK